MPHFNCDHAPRFYSEPAPNPVVEASSSVKQPASKKTEIRTLYKKNDPLSAQIDLETYQIKPAPPAASIVIQRNKVTGPRRHCNTNNPPPSPLRIPLIPRRARAAKGARRAEKSNFIGKLQAFVV